jgi:hypothetical protein
MGERNSSIDRLVDLGLNLLDTRLSLCGLTILGNFEHRKPLPPSTRLYDATSVVTFKLQPLLLKKTICLPYELT